MKRSLLFSFVFSISACIQIQAADYYWVGGSGDYADLSHWATTSGGNSTYTVVPSADDNVFFDINSFSDSGQVVTISSDAVCRDMNWNGADWPVLTGNAAAKLRIFGSLTLDSSMKYSFYGLVSFESTLPGNTITLAGQGFYNHVTFNNPTGSWSLQDDFNIYDYGAIYFESGSLYTNGHNVNCAYFRSENSSPRWLSFDNSTLTVRYFLRINSENLDFNCGNSKFVMTGFNPEFSAGDYLIYNRVLFTNDSSNVIYFNGNNIYNTVILEANTIISGSNTFDTLVCSPGKTYEIGSNKQETIIDVWSLNGTCTGSITIKSTSSGTSCYINSTDGIINGNYLLLKDTWVSGGANFIADNSVNLGNNSGWIISEASPKNYYWIGNGGYWNDPAHWADSSGGISGGCIPNFLDNVYFDQNSFTLPGQVVIIDEDAKCNSMDWSEVALTPTLTASQSEIKIKINGSLILSTHMILAFPGKVVFESSSDSNIIISNNNVFNNDVSFTGTGSWHLGDNIHVNAAINFDNGTFSTNNKTIRCIRLHDRYPDDNLFCNLYFGSSDIYVTKFLYIDIPPQYFNSGSSCIYMEGPEAYFGCSGYEQFNRVIFSDTTRNLSYLGTYGKFRYLSFASNALIDGPNIMDTLILSAGYTFYIKGEQTVNHLLRMEGNCNRRIFLTFQSQNVASRIVSSNGIIQGSYLIIDHVEALGGAYFTADNSVDLGGNTGWTINEETAKNLYWVNDGGNWNDPNHWSLTSGGQGGTCIPSPIDNVFFDEHSFTQPGQAVTMTDYMQYCHDMKWDGVQFNPTFQGGASYTAMTLKIFGSLSLDSNMVNNINPYTVIEFSSDDTNNTIQASVPISGSVRFSGTGKWDLLCDLTSYGTMHLTNGILQTHGHTVRCYQFYAGNWNADATVRLVLDTSTLNCFGEVFYIDSYTDVPLSNYTIVINTNLHAYNQEINRVIFNSYGDLGTSILYAENCLFHTIKFNGDGIITGSQICDSLMFSDGKSYLLESQATQIVNDYLDIRGNNCFPISLNSSQSGSLATISIPSGEVSGDFLELRDIEATGGAVFYAGNQSTDLGNNPGWIWGDAPGYVFGFPTDTSICAGDTLVLTTDNFNGGTAWLWQNGSTSPTYTVTQPGTYTCRVTYAENCYIQDSIVVEVHQIPDILAQPNTQMICSGDTAEILLSSPNGTTGVTYVWTASLESGTNTTGFSDGSGDLISQTIENTGSSIANILYTITPWNHQCSGSSANATVLVKVHASSVSGRLLYDQQESVPVTCARIFLVNDSGMTTDSALTDVNGYYRFCDVPDGSYHLVASTDKPWGGVNATDALMTLRQFVMLDTLTGMRLLACDVDNNHHINSIDALLMAARYVEMIDSFAIPDWLFEVPEFILSGITDLTHDISAICAGDVNASHLPPGCGK